MRQIMQLVGWLGRLIDKRLIFSETYNEAKQSVTSNNNTKLSILRFTEKETRKDREKNGISHI